MALWEGLIGIVAGGSLTIAGTWAGSHWQAREARRMRAEQYAREDATRGLDVRRQTYARFAQLGHELYDKGWPVYDTGHKMHDLRSKHGEESKQAKEAETAFWAASRAHGEASDAVIVALWELELLAGPSVVEAARAVLDSFYETGWVDSPEPTIEAVRDFVRAARIELGLPDAGLRPL